MRNLFELITFPLRALQRQIDIHVLWPEVVKRVTSLDDAHNAMLFHVLRDRVWTVDFTYDEIIEYIKSLK